MVAPTGFSNYLAARLGPGTDVGASSPYTVPAGWGRPRRLGLDEWRAAHGGALPNRFVTSLIVKQIEEIKRGIWTGENIVFEHHHNVLTFLIKNGRLPTGYGGNSGENAALIAAAVAEVGRQRDAYSAAHPSALKQIGGAVSSVASVVGSVASLVPGVGTVVGGALGAVAAVGRGDSIADIALGAARGALPGGAVAQVAFDVAVGAAKGQNVTGIALGALRNQIPGGDLGKAAFDAGLAVAYHATPKEAAAGAAALPKAVRAAFAKPVMAAHKVRRAPPVLVEKAIRKERAHTRARPLSRRGKAWVAHALKTKAGARLRDTGALSADGRSYIVEKGDSAWRIAQNLTGDGNKHVLEILRANAPPKAIIRNGMTLASGATIRMGDNFKYLKTGEILKIPAVWIGKFVNKTAQTAPPAPGAPVPSLPPPRAVPVTQPPPQAPSSPLPAAVIPPVKMAPLPAVVDPGKLPPTAERDDPAAIAQAKTILVAWEHTDGVAAAGLPDYGGNPADTSPIWGARDSWELRAFVVWSNAHGTALSLLGDLTQAKLDALVAWAENRAKQIATGEGSVSPTGIPAPAPAGGDGVRAEGPSPIPVVAGPSTLPAGAEARNAALEAQDRAEAQKLPPMQISKAGATEGEGSGFGFGLAALALLGIGVAFSGKDRKRAA